MRRKHAGPPSFFPGLVCLVCLVSALTPAEARFRTAAELAEAVLSDAGATPTACPDDVVDGIGPDLTPVCATVDAGTRAFRLALEDVLESDAYDGYPFAQVLDWDELDGRFVHGGYWLGAVSVDFLIERDGPLVVALGSKSYPKCGDSVPFAPSAEMMTRGLEGARNRPIELAPESYPKRAAKKKIDGAVALAVDLDADGLPEVRCIHHESPGGWGFAYSAIDSVRKWREAEVGAAKTEPQVVNVIVRFSKFDERPDRRLPGFHGN